MSLLPLFLWANAFLSDDGRHLSGKFLKMGTLEIDFDFLLYTTGYEYSDCSCVFLNFIVIVSPATVVSSLWKESSDWESIYFLEEKAVNIILVTSLYI